MHTISSQPVKNGVALLIAGWLFGTTTTVLRADNQDTARRAHPTTQSDPLTRINEALEANNGERALAELKKGPSSIPSATRRLLEGRALLILEKPAEARRKLQAAVKLRPKDPHAHYWLARAQLRLEAYALAAREFRAAHWHGLDTTELHLQWAHALRKGGQLLGLVSRRPWSEDDGPRPKPADFLGDSLVVGAARDQPGWLILSPIDSALFQAARARSLAPDDPDAALLCAELWAQIDEHQTAITFFESAAACMASHPSPARSQRLESGWAASLLALGDTDAFLAHERRRLNIPEPNASNPSAPINKTAGAEMAKSYDQAAAQVALRGELPRLIAYLTRAAEFDSNSDRLLRLADALLQARRTDDANRILRLALDQNPSPETRRAIEDRLSKSQFLAAPR